MEMIILTRSEREERLNLVSKIKLKDVVLGRGHDCGGLIAEVYMGRTKVADFHDDGWGGIPEVNYASKELEKKLKDYISSSGALEHILRTDYRDFKKQDISQEELVHILVDNIAVYMEELKEIKKLQTKALVLEKDGKTYTIDLRLPVARFKKDPQGVTTLINLMRKQIKDGYTILNTNTKGLPV